DRKTYAFSGLGQKLEKMHGITREAPHDFSRTDIEVKETVPIADIDLPVVEAPLTRSVEEPDDGAYLLFTTPTCPNCKAAQLLLKKANVNFRVLNANEEKDLVDHYDIKQAPTLVVFNGDGYEKYRGVSDIKGWILGH
ncbi:MAG: hypothetical protein IIZ47_00315, partial [Erysipelotrichaceae bacterium]|nr:hypothetical protein [Erysipelotrichaceae bacterium]